MKTKSYKTRTQFIEHKSVSLPNDWIIGLDIGYSAVKGMAPNKVFCFPSYAMRVSDDKVILKEPSPTDILYRDEESTWFVGNLAFNQVTSAEVVDSESEMFGRNRYDSDLFKVISRVGIAAGLMKNGIGECGKRKVSIQAGLPPKYKADGKYVKEALSGPCEFDLKIGKNGWQHFSYNIAPEDIYVMPQPLGSLICSTMTREGNQTQDAAKFMSTSLIILDPGFGTFDDYVVNMGVVNGSNTFSNLGMKEVFKRTVEKINEQYGEDIGIHELQKYLDEGTITVVNRREMRSQIVSFAGIMEEASKEVCNDAIRKMMSTHDYLKDVKYIIATGGTYDAWKSEIDAVLSRMQGITVISANRNVPELSNVYSNVRGYFYFLTNRIKSKRR